MTWGQTRAGRVMLAVLVVAAIGLLPAVSGYAAGPPRPTQTGLRVSYCPFPCSNASQNVPYYTTAQFWGNLGDALLASGIITAALAVTVYRHLSLAMFSVGVLGAAIIIIVVI